MSEQHSLWTRVRDAIDKQTGRYQFGLGERYRRRGQLDEAVVAFEAAEHWETANMGPKHPMWLPPSSLARRHWRRWGGLRKRAANIREHCT